MRTILLLVLVSGCASLGPMPMTTGLSAVPSPTFDATAQAGYVPGYYLSSSAADKPNGAPIPQLLAAIDPGKIVPGLVVGGRVYGEDDTAVEPMIGYRKTLGKEQNLSVAAFLFGTHKKTTFQHATYAATRAGLEGAADLRLNGPHRWIEAHAIGSLSLTNVSADGTYCVDGDHAVDCEDPFPSPAPPMDSAEVSGVYPGVTIGLAADLFRHRGLVFHGARLEAKLGAGAMPTVRDGQQGSFHAFLTIGLGLSLSFGAK